MGKFKSFTRKIMGTPEFEAKMTLRPNTGHYYPEENRRTLEDHVFALANSGTFEHIFSGLNSTCRTALKHGHKTTFINRLEKQFSGTGYAVYTYSEHGGNVHEGYLDPQKTSGSLNKAKIFQTPELAASFTHKHMNYCIVEVSLKLSKVLEGNLKDIPPTLAAGVAMADKERLLESRNQLLLEKLKEYEIKLQEAGMLEKPKPSSPKKL